MAGDRLLIVDDDPFMRDLRREQAERRAQPSRLPQAARIGLYGTLFRPQAPPPPGDTDGAE